jgi:hypothetical protein
MKRIRIASTVLFFLLFAAFAYAAPQQDEPKAKDASPAMQKPDAKPEAKPETQEQKPDEMKPEKNDQDKQDQKDAKDQEKENKDKDKDKEKQDKKDDKNSGKDMGNMRDENHANAQPAGKGGRIPDDKFRASFGRSHSFHPSRPTVVNGRPTFAYGGYSFVLVDPWPAEWAYTDDCYIDYVDGEYFLFDLLHPGVRIALVVSM